MCLCLDRRKEREDFKNEASDDSARGLLATQLDWVRLEDAQPVKTLHNDLISSLLVVCLDAEADCSPVERDYALEVIASLFFMRLEWHAELRRLTELRLINVDLGVRLGDILRLTLSCVHNVNHDLLVCNEPVCVRMVVEKIGV